MRVASVGLCLVVAGLASTPAHAGPCDDPAATIYALTAPAYRVDGEPVLGRSAYACGRFWSAANLMQKAAVQRSSSLQRFNLAATYAQTGRFEEADALYRTVIADGDFVRARADSSPRNGEERETGFGLAEEATRRLAAITRLRALLTPASQTSLAPTPSQTAALAGGPTGPRAAEQAGVNAVTVENRTGPLPAGAAGVDAVATQSGISDLEALRRDGLVEPQ
ncbi:hypothetical protein [Brevundimonas variabilis]|uniref:Tetratricopeptide repeat protein n=1 Tax=Brevundimonas variabilis TaxID=74312 RepID=A0A7W9CIL3_9CAUL|nr:hypothetical protein [Brevundimonas variabilis]MBB5746360.1 hypothetical protein [Brevundimonas variabilis]